jgi:predicted alpha/beta-hydrolase family hydrolase
LQGERDTMGCRDEVAGYRLSAAIELCWLSDGDHSLKPRRASGHTEADNLAAAIAAINHFLTTL